MVREINTTNSMHTEDLGKYFQIIHDKGWNVYFRGTAKEKIPVGESMQRGPVSSLESNIRYALLPKIEDAHDKSAINEFIRRHQTIPEIIVPPSFNYYGRVVAKFDKAGKDEVERPLTPQEHITFVGFEFLPKEVRLISPNRTFMPYEVFETALRSLRNISLLKGI
ncbi:MAG TPA: hypothetical protein VJH95_01785 [Candidatus Nanoarchaeia archaeon]|nr:hypothetical protein [Candidatus Nanoarchaeia archaeon]